MKRFLLISTYVALVLSLAFPAVPSFAATNSKDLCEGSGGKWTVNDELPNGGSCTSPDGRTVAGTIQQITDVLIFLIGAIAVLMIIIGGIRYAISAGDQAALTSAKNTILYAIVGLVVAFTAYAIVRFVYTVFNIK